MTKLDITANSDKRNTNHPIRVIAILVMIAIGLIYLYEQSFKTYWQQTYHIDLENYYTLFSSDTTSNKPDTNELTSKNSIDNTQLAAGIAEENQWDRIEDLTQPIVLNKNDTVLFAGDSLMQGIAPHAKKILYKRYKIESIDLSEQNTGLTYPSAFNWPKTIDEALDSDPSIKLLVIFLGPNDPWKFPIKHHSRYAEFKSALWEQTYRSRIERILNSAKEHQVHVLWLAVPCMRKPKLNDDIVYLNSLYRSETEQAYQHFLTTNELLGCSYDQFKNFIEADRTKIKVRIDDGIHFTRAGQKILARAIINKIIVNE